MKNLKTFWEFTRPHTLIGTFTSISALWIMASGQINLWPVGFWLALFSAVSCNIFITGYNQLVDVSLDKVNKPWLPLASGAISERSANGIVVLALASAFAFGLLHSIFLFGLVLIISLIGFLYSFKKIYLKRRHSLAAIAITLVRGFLVNAGFYLIFTDAGLSFSALPNFMWLLILFVFCFSLGISWFKDIPDTAGDASAHVNSLAINIGVNRAFTAGILAVSTGYTLVAIAPISMNIPAINTRILCIGHIVLGLVFLFFTSRTHPGNQASMGNFYMLFWVLFVCEYILFAISILMT